LATRRLASSIIVRAGIVSVNCSPHNRHPSLRPRHYHGVRFPPVLCVLRGGFSFLGRTPSLQPACWTASATNTGLSLPAAGNPVLDTRRIAHEVRKNACPGPWASGVPGVRQKTGHVACAGRRCISSFSGACHRTSEARARRVCEGVENHSRHAGPVVPDPNQTTAGMPGERNADRALAAHRLCGVHEQVLEHDAQLLGIGGNRAGSPSTRNMTRASAGSRRRSSPILSISLPIRTDLRFGSRGRA